MIKVPSRKKLHQLHRKAVRHISRHAAKHKGKISLALLLTGLTIGTGGILWVTNSILAQTFSGPQCSAGQCSGAISISGGAFAVGTSSPISDTKFFILASSTQSAGFAVKVLSPGSTVTNGNDGIVRGGPLLLIRNDGKIGIGGFIGDTTTSTVVIGGNTRVNGTLAATTLVGTISGNLGAENIAAGSFGSIAGTGNYTFPANVTTAGSLRIGTIAAPNPDIDPIVIRGTNATKVGINLENRHATNNKTEILFYNDAAAGAGWALASDYFATGQDNFVIWGGGSGAPRLFISAAGNISIGTSTTPTAMLDVAGTLRAGTGRFEVDAVGDINDPGGSVVGVNDSFAINSPGILTVAGTVSSTFAGPIVAGGLIHSTAGGIKFPDGTTQTTAATGVGATPTFTSVNAGTYLVGAVARLSESGNYTVLLDDVGDNAIYLGGADPGNYYDNTTHYFRANDHSTVFATVNSGGITSYADFKATNNYGYGLVGVYSATRYQGVFAMGDAYKLSADGTSSGSLYGIAWTHSNIGGQSKAGLGHQALFMTNGVTQSAIGTGIWTNGSITGGSTLYAPSGVHAGSNLLNWPGYNGLAQQVGQYVWPGSISGYGEWQQSAYIASHSAYGLYTATGFYHAGAVWASAFYYTSDLSLKKDIKPVAGLDVITKLDGVTFRWRESGEKSAGLIAQNVEKVLPEAVYTDPNTGKKSIVAGALDGSIVEAIKELNDKADRQAKLIDQLKKEIRDLRRK
jgi:hypothetical protein